MKAGKTIPDLIFHWLQLKSFKKLTASEQEDVSEFLTPEEYDDMHFALRVIPRNRDEQRKTSVLEAFDRQHMHKIRYLSVGWIGKAAAVILPAGLIAGLYLLKQGNALEALVQARPVDTMYVEKKVVGPKEIIHDTVYLLKIYNSPTPKNSGLERNSPPDVAAHNDEMRGLSLEELRAISAEKKGSSLEDDTLWMSFETVPL
jgi:hypothetical protein